MRGDLHTLKRICEYASKVMLVAEYVLAALAVATLVLIIASFFSEAAEDLVRDWVDSNADETYRMVASSFKFLIIWIMGFLTVKGVHDVMCDIRDEHSPFTVANTDRIILISKIYLVGAFVLLIIDVVAGTQAAFAAFVFLGCLLISVVMYCLALVCRYGGVLQKESDETL